MKNLFVLSGLGADERAFQFMDFSNYKVTFIKWIQPQDETLAAYAGRLLGQITASNPVLVGLSFGGMVAIEIAKLINTDKVIIMASAKTRSEIPFYYRLAGFCKFHKLLPVEIVRQANYTNNWFFGVQNDRDSKLLSAIITDTDPVFLKWAIDKIVTWQNRLVPSNLLHIHGTSDRILPMCFVNPDFRIKGGGHFMTLDKAEEVTIIINQLLAE